LCRLLYTIERYRTLLKEAQTRIDTLGLTNVTAKVGDGTKGWQEQAPFDRIILTAAAPSMPEKIISQLKTGGVAIIPIDVAAADGGGQLLVKVTKTEDGFEREDLLPVRFVPMVEGVAREL
ncbi:MAG: protein-L-isoaspartate O-methyltransferase, partial [Candidatus Phaeomarinobacter sp.]